MNRPSYLLIIIEFDHWEYLPDPIMYVNSFTAGLNINVLSKLEDGIINCDHNDEYVMTSNRNIYSTQARGSTMK